MLKRIFKALLIFIASFLGFVGIYMLTAYFLSRITVNEDVPSKKEVKVYILSNGVHTDIVVPKENELMDWTRYVDYKDTKGKDSTANFVAFGWGDKGFYMETPTWGDLTFRVAFRAAFGLSTSALHTTLYKEIKEGKTCKSIYLSKKQYRKLVNFITNSFEKNKDGGVIHIRTDAVYGANDAFYEAEGSYSLFHTCNTWANNALKACDQKASLWTPYTSGIFYHYPD
jgi:uncharacterized protein (TIGR02117 family)